MRYSLPSRELIADSVEVMTQAHRLRRHGYDFKLRQSHTRHAHGSSTPKHPSNIHNRRTNDTQAHSTEKKSATPQSRSRRQQLRRQTRQQRTRPTRKRGMPRLRLLQRHVHSKHNGMRNRSIRHVTTILRNRLSQQRTKTTNSQRNRRKNRQTHIRKHKTHRHPDPRQPSKTPSSVDTALGGSTNTVLHLSAIAKEAEVTLPLAFFDEVGKRVPHLCNMIPSGPYDLEELDNAGGYTSIDERTQTVTPF